MKIFLIILAAAAAITASGCVTDQERMAQIADHDDQQCKSFGTAYGTPEYAQCRQNLLSIRNANGRAALQAFALSHPAMQPTAPQPYMMPVNRPVNTNCTVIGQNVSCNSY